MEDMFELLALQRQQQELAQLLDCNKKTEQYSLELSLEEANSLITARKDALGDTQRVEFGKGILPKLIDLFCDSQYINQDNYAETLSELQDIFYTYKNETPEEMTDDELLNFMRRQFEDICFGDLEYLRNTCLERFARATRTKTKGHMQSRLRDEYSLRDTENEYSRLSEETRWDYEVYKMKLEDMY